MGRALTNIVYSNCTMLSPNGEFMCRLARKRANWYVSRKLANVVSDDPYTIQLIFEPNGLGHNGDAYYASSKENCCVVCGSLENLTKHHSVPHRYRKFFPIKVKNHNSHDILPLCVDCHDAYEMKADSFRKLLASEAGLIDIEEKKNLLEVPEIMVAKYAHTLCKHGEKIPPPRKVYLLSKISAVLGREVNDAELLELANQPVKRPKNCINLDGKYVTEYFLNGDGIEEFICRWRKHFVETMNPQFLPKHWNVDRKL